MLDREKWRLRIRHILTLDSHPGHIAAGFAVGVFISFTPFFGIHTPLAIAAALLLRLNKLTCITGAWINTPLTVFPALGISYKLGRILRGLPPPGTAYQGAGMASPQGARHLAPPGEFHPRLRGGSGRLFCLLLPGSSLQKKG